MKKILFISIIAAFLFGIYQTTNAQMLSQENGQSMIKVQYGVIGGLNFADFMGKGISNAESRITGNGGLFATVQFGKYFAVQPEARINFSGATQKLTVGKLNYRLAYIHVPLFLKGRYELQNGLTPYVMAGPSIAIRVSDKYKYDGVNNNSSGNINELNMKTNDTLFDLNFGVGLQFDRLMLSGRYQYGLTDIFKNINTQHSIFTINLGIGLNPSTR